MSRTERLTCKKETVMLYVKASRCAYWWVLTKRDRALGPEDLVGFLCEEGIRWVKAQREAHRPDARPLLEGEKARLRGFFAETSLDTVRIKTSPAIEAPEFLFLLRERRGVDPIDFRFMVGITFVDTVVIRRSMAPSGPKWISLLFHEMVHVVQCETLGIERFVEEYVKGWAAKGFDYYSIPMERQAYDLQARYEAGRDCVFSVNEEVRRDWVNEGHPEMRGDEGWKIL